MKEGERSDIGYRLARADNKFTSQIIPQHGDQRLIRRRHRVVAKPHRHDPFDRLAFHRRHRAGPLAADVKRHQQMKFLIGMGCEGEGRQTAFDRIDAELFAQFADQRPFRRLAGLDLAAGKFPQPGHRFACGTLRDQHTSVDIEQCDGGDKNSRQIGHFRRARRHPGSGPVIGIDVDVAVRQIAGPDGG